MKALKYTNAAHKESDASSQEMECFGNSHMLHEGLALEVSRTSSKSSEEPSSIAKPAALLNM